MAVDFTLVWLIFEWMIFGIIVGPITIFFFLKYKHDKSVQDKEGMRFDLRFMTFFILNAINQLLYIIDTVHSYRESIPGWIPIFAITIENVILYEYSILSHDIITVFLFLCSFTQIIYPAEKFMQKS